MRACAASNARSLQRTPLTPRFAAQPARPAPCVVAVRRARPSLRAPLPRVQPRSERARRACACAASAAAPDSRKKKSWWLQIGGDDDPRLPPPESLAVVASRLASLAKEDAPLLALAAVFMVAAALAELAIPTYLSRAIAAATAGGDSKRFQGAIRMLLTLAVSFGVLSGARGASFSFVNQRLVRRLRERLFASLAAQPISFFDAHDVGELTSRLGADSAAVARAVCTNVNVLARNALQVLFGGVLLAALSPKLAAAAAGVTLLLWLATEKYGRFSRCRTQPPAPTGWLRRRSRSCAPCARRALRRRRAAATECRSPQCTTSTAARAPRTEST